MYLKALAIKGFKSFADPAVMQFEPGVTVVVGPNGSGKSNVVDAVAWVLGAQGPRTVRSSKMEDVIFAGSADRPALGRAEVSLTIDNRAGRLPGGLAEITITRTLFRSGDSEYALNGQPCRLLDVQELLSDSGVGRQQHVIVSQGQLDHILQARPEDRRTVIEEAAGVLKHRRRRERAERRLAVTEENLERLGDLVREVRRQIRPLERQAVAARSHASLTAERRGLRLYLVGRELAALDDRADRVGLEHQQLERQELDLRDQLAALDAALETATAELSSRREEDLVLVLTRVQGLVERCRGLGGVLAERRRSVARALDDSADTDVVSTLEAEAARLGADLEQATTEAEELRPRAAEVELAEAELAADLGSPGGALDADRLRAAGDAYARARGEIEPLRRGLERERVALARSAERVERAEVRRKGLADERDLLAAERAELDERLAEARRTAAEASKAAAAAAEASEAAEVRSREAERERHRLEARAEALMLAADEARGAAGLDAVAGVAGVLGLLGDQVNVDEGWRSAFEAAAGAALAGVTVDSVDTARATLRRLHEQGASGTVLPPLPRAPQPVPAAPPGSEPVRPHVRGASAAVDGILDALVGAAVAVGGGWEDAADLAVAHPGAVVVTRQGGRFAPGGWRLQVEEVATGAAVVEARRLAEEAAAVADAASSVRSEARQLSAEAAEDARRVAHGVDRMDDRSQTVGAALDRAARQVATLDEELASARRQHAETVERVERDGAALDILEERLPELELAAREAAEALADVEEARRQTEARRAAVSDARRQLEVRAAGLAERRAVLVDRLADVERRLAGHVAERERAAARRQRLESEATAVDRLGAIVDMHAGCLGDLLADLQQRRNAQLAELRQGGARLEGLRQQRQQIDQRLDAVRQRLQRLEVELAESGVRRDAAVDTLARELGSEVADALAAPAPELTEGVDAAQRAATVDAELAALGPVNPLALDELAELEERYQLLEQQVDDVKGARRELQQVIKAVDDEVVRVFAEAFADVNEHFQVLVGALFPGGTGRLSLTEPEDLLNTGVEVEARPAGKNVRKLTLLSGGERSLVALAFLFAVFRSRPSPFYLLDEVEAALDDVNLHRFLALLHEFRDEAQLIVVSHQKRTMESADALYGVTMQAGGSSKVVSQKVRRDVGQEARSHTAPAAT